MSRSSADDSCGAGRVALAGFGIGLLLVWTDWMFHFPSDVMPTEPNGWWFVAGAALCTAAALTSRPHPWAGAVAAPAAGIFSAWCVVFFAAHVKPRDWGSYPPPPLGYGGTALIAFCAVLPLAALAAVALRQCGSRRSVCVGAAAGLCIAPFVAFVGFNVADYTAFRLALRRANGLTERQLSGLAAECGKIETQRRYTQADWPSGFTPLRPQFVSTSPGLSYASLYSRGTLYLELRVDTTEAHPGIYYFSNVDGPQKTVWLGTRPRIQGEDRPSDRRIVTLSEYSIHAEPAWVVTADRIRVVGVSEKNGKFGVLAEAPLSPAARAEIESAAALTKRLIGKRAFEAPVSDGLGLEICFSTTGVRTEDDIILHNAWVEQAGPLIRAVARHCPPEMPLRYEQDIQLMREHWEQWPIAIRSIVDARSEQPAFPWWCVWRRFASEQLVTPKAIKFTTNIPDARRYVDGR
jgi:hypothetical protein